MCSVSISLSCYDFIHDRIICMRKDFFSLLLWLLGDGFNTTWQDVLHGEKLGLYGGSIGGIGLALFRLFKVKGF